MKPGLRVQLLLLLGGLLLATFAPLYLAVSTYTRVTLRRLRDSSVSALARSVAAPLSDAQARSRPELRRLVDSALRSPAVVAIALSDEQGRPLVSGGSPEGLEAIATHPPSSADGVELFELRGLRPGPAPDAPRLHELVAHVHDERRVTLLLRAEDPSDKAPALLSLVGLYMAVIAAALLLLAYFALTRLIVQPLDELARASERVASSSRRLEIPASRTREIAMLGASLRTMTEKLLRDEEALRRKVAEVEQARDQLEQAQSQLVRSERLASVGRLSAGLAHEVGNPIAALLGLQDLLLSGDLEPDEQQDFLRRIRAETERIHRILRDLLQFARPAPVSAEPGDVGAAVEDTVQLLAPQSSMRDVSLEVDIEPDLPRVSLGTAQLTQVLLNLLLNAGDATGGTGSVSIRVRRSETGVRVEVEDDGPGIDSAVSSQLFEPFVTTKDVGKGTGLGLSVCRGLAEGAGGSIDVDGDYVDGARFVLELPVALPGA